MSKNAVSQKVRLISIDSSSTKTGWAIFDNCKLEQYGIINLDTKECKKKYKNNSDERIKDMCLSIIQLLEKCSPDIIVIEKLSVSRNMVSVRALCKILGAVYCYSILKDIFYCELQPTEWRSKLGIQSAKKREELKRLSIEYVKNNYDIETVDDISDAICIGDAYIKIFS